MKAIRKCKYCGKEFVARSGMQKYCCEECQTKAKEARKKRQQNFMNAVEPVIGLQNQEYLTFAKAAILMGCSRQYVYKLVNEGKLVASRISSRMAFIRKADIENNEDKLSFALRCHKMAKTMHAPKYRLRR